MKRVFIYGLCAIIACVMSASCTKQKLLDGPIDLSASKSANCYIVRMMGEYKFNACVRGNGVATEGLAAALPIEADGAFLVWESTKGMITDISLKEGYIYFTCSGRSGNAVLAATKEGEIVWSWHIWYPKNALAIVSARNGYKFLNMNLGAISADAADSVQTYGLLYQWGRKDPFPAAATPTGDTSTQPAEVYDASGNVVEIGHTSWISLEDNTIEYAVAHPTTVICSKAQTLSSKDWLSDSNDALWGCPDKTQKGAKSYYDPCPAGWRVPPADALKFATTSGGYDIDPDNFSVEGEFNYGWNLVMDKENAVTSFFPAAGRYDGGWGMLFGSVAGLWGSYWGNAPYSEGGLGYCILAFQKTSMSPAAGAARSDAYSIRCVAE